MRPLRSPYTGKDVCTAVRSRWFRRVVAIAAGVAVLSILYLWQYVNLLEVNYDFERNRRRLGELERESSSLRMELYRRRSLEQVGAVAREKLVMRPPEKGEIIIVKE